MRCAERHPTITRALANDALRSQLYRTTVCGGEESVSGSLASDHALGANVGSWRIKAGYKPDIGVLATASGFQLDASHWFKVEASGAFSGVLGQGTFAVPMELVTPDFGVLSTRLEIYAVPSCDALADCGLDLAPQNQTVSSYVPETPVRGRILCQDGRPAGVIMVAAHTLEGSEYDTYSHRYATALTDSNGYYSIDVSWLSPLTTTKRVTVRANLKDGHDNNTGFNKNHVPYFLGEALHEGDASVFTAPSAGPTVPVAKLEFGYIEGTADLDPLITQSNPRVNGDVYAQSYGESQPSYNSARWCYGCDVSGTRLEGFPEDEKGGYRIKVVQGAHKVFYQDINFNRYYWRIHGDGGYPAHSAPDFVDGEGWVLPSEGKVVYVIPGETVTLQPDRLPSRSWLIFTSSTKRVSSLCGRMPFRWRYIKGREAAILRVFH